MDTNIITAIIITIIWGISPVFQKKLLKDLSYETVMITSGIIYFLFLMIFGLLMRDNINFNRIDRKMVNTFILISLMTITSMILYFYLLKEKTSSYVIILTSMYPLITVIIGHLLLGEKLNSNLLILMLLIMLSVIIVR